VKKSRENRRLRFVAAFFHVAVFPDLSRQKPIEIQRSRNILGDSTRHGRDTWRPFPQMTTRDLDGPIAIAAGHRFEQAYSSSTKAPTLTLTFGTLSIGSPLPDGWEPPLDPYVTVLRGKNGKPRVDAQRLCGDILYAWRHHWRVKRGKIATYKDDATFSQSQRINWAIEAIQVFRPDWWGELSKGTLLKEFKKYRSKIK
jgi:hypothetical protein